MGLISDVAGPEASTLIPQSLSISSPGLATLGHHLFEGTAKTQQDEPLKCLAAFAGQLWGPVDSSGCCCSYILSVQKIHTLDLLLGVTLWVRSGRMMLL